MMKKRIIAAVTAALALVLASTYVFAAEILLSPALDIIANKCTMVKSASSGKNVNFTNEDFDLAAGKKVSSITIYTLPDSSEGILTIGGNKVSRGQTISAVNFDLLSFYPKEGTNECSFEFSTDSSYTTKCVIKLTDGVNSAPVNVGTSGIVLSTQRDITCYGTLKGHDADGDSLMYEIVDFPTMGIVHVTDVESGNFSYTPYSGVTGYDCFSYRIRDEYGNYSEIAEVSLKISERKSEDVYADMTDHWAYNAALSVVSDGAMDVIYENGSLYFDPDEKITRAEYLKSVMKALGAGDLKAAKTVFEDDSDIGDEFSGYVNAAYKLGIIKGNITENGLSFSPNDIITKAEAAVILNRILGAVSKVATSFSDSEIIPSWAENDIQALSSLGIINGYEGFIDPYESVTRAEAAQMLYIAKALYS